MEQIDEEETHVVECLYKRWSRVYQFVGWAVKRKVNRDALLQTLKACLAKRIPSDECWAYCVGCLKIVNGNHNEKEFQAKAAKEKMDFKKLADALKVVMDGSKPGPNLSPKDLKSKLPF